MTDTIADLRLPIEEAFRPIPFRFEIGNQTIGNRQLEIGNDLARQQLPARITESRSRIFLYRVAVGAGKSGAQVRAAR